MKSKRFLKKFEMLINIAPGDLLSEGRKIACGLQIRMSGIS